MDQGLVGLAFAAGLVAALNPCGFAMLPAYLLLVVRGEGPAVSSGVAAAGLRGGSAVTGVTIYLAYSAGLTLVVGVLAVAAATASSAMADRARRILPFVNRIGGALLVLVGLYVAYYGSYEVRLFGANGKPQDAVIIAAGRLQGAVAGWVHQHGIWPWVIAALALAIFVVGGAWHRRAQR